MLYHDYDLCFYLKSSVPVRSVQSSYCLQLRHITATTLTMHLWNSIATHACKEQHNAWL